MIDWTKLLGGMGGQQQAAGQKTPWLNREGMGGLSKGELLMAGMGMLSGRNLQEGFGNSAQIAYGGMERKRKEQEKQEKSAALAKAMGMMQSGDAPGAKVALAGLYPDAVGGAMAEQAFAGPQKPMVVNGRVVDPNDPSKVIADYSDGEDMNLPSGMFMNPKTGQPEYLPGYIEGQRQIAEARGSNANNVQSTFTGADGTQYIVRRDGSLEPLGVKARNPFQITDVGGVPTAIDRLTGQGQQVTSPETVGANKATIDTITANEGDRRDAQKALPKAIADAELTITSVQNLLDSPGFNSRYGAASVVPAIPGTAMAETQALIEQVNGQVFLDAYASLRGAQAITDIEGQKATAAKTRLNNQGLRPEDARAAAEELISIVKKGVERAKAQASGSYAPQGADAPALKYNPATGEFE